MLPSLDSIWSTGVSEWSGTLASATWVTTEEVLLGFLLSIVIALVIAFALHSSRVVRNAVYPLLIGSQAVPVVVIAPVLAIIFGYTITPKLIVVTLICFFPIVVNTIDGLASVDPELLRVMRTLDGNRWATLRRVEAPAALPSIFSGLRIAATYAPIGAVFGEYAGSQNGLGYVMIQAIPQLETALVFAAIFILTAEAILLFIAVSVARADHLPMGTRRETVTSMTAVRRGRRRGALIIGAAAVMSAVVACGSSSPSSSSSGSRRQGHDQPQRAAGLVPEP